MCFLSSPLPPLCCRFIPGPNRELPSQGCVPGSSPLLIYPLFSSHRTGLKLLHLRRLTGLPGTTERISTQIKTALLVWCQGFETRLIPCLINEPHVGDSPLPHSCGQFPTCSLSHSLSLSLSISLSFFLWSYSTPPPPSETETA